MGPPPLPRGPVAALSSVPPPPLPILPIQGVKWEGLGFKTKNSRGDKTEVPEIGTNNQHPKESDIPRWLKDNALPPGLGMNNNDHNLTRNESIHP